MASTSREASGDSMISRCKGRKASKPKCFLSSGESSLLSIMASIDHSSYEQLKEFIEAYNRARD
jgi:hypothetical protein